MLKNSLFNLLKSRRSEFDNKTAIIFNGKSINYIELENKSDCLANYFLSIGLKENDKICVLMDKSFNLIITYYAIVKSGLVFVPLSKKYPKERINYIIEDSHAEALICDYNILLNLENTKKIIYKENLFINCRKMIFEPHNHLSYILYTSGTSGKPKGVAISGDAITNTIESINREYRISSDSIMFQFASITFGSSIVEIFPALIQGATLYLPTEDETKDIKTIASTIKNAEITVLTLPATILKNINFKDYDGIDTLITAGSSCSVEIANRLRKQVKHFIYAYGSTECAVCCLVSHIEEDYFDYLPLGKEIDNVKVYILNSNLQKVDLEEDGDIYVSGISLADCYINNSELTAQKFIKNPFNKDEILFKTGDHVRLHKNNSIEYLGRSDLMINFNGIRIDPCEIENIIKKINDADECIVCEKRIAEKNLLCCFYTTKTKNNLNEEEIIEKLKNELPLYMLPTFYKRVNKFNTNINGKLDRFNISFDLQFEYNNNYANYNKAQKQICKLIEELEPNLDFSKSFITQGFDSLLIMILVEKYNTKFYDKIAPFDIFNCKNINEFIESKKKISFAQKNDILLNKIYKLSRLQQSYWFNFKANSNSTEYNLFDEIEIKSEIDPKKMISSIKKILTHYEILKYKKIDNELNITFEEKNYFPVKYLDLSEQIETFNSLVSDLINFKFNLQEGFFYKIYLVKKENKVFSLLFLFHHIIFDYRSFQVILNSIFGSYFKNEIFYSPFQYSNFVATENTVLRNKEASGFWKKSLSGKKLTNDIPRDRYTNFENDKNVYITTELFKNEINVTDFIVYLGSLIIMANRITQNDEVSISVPVNLRTTDFNDTIGLFVNTIIFNYTIDNTVSIKDFFNDVSLKFFKALEYKYYPIADIPSLVNIDRTGKSICNVLLDYTLDFLGSIENNFNIKLNRISYLETKKTFCDLVISVCNKNGRCTYNYEFNTNIYSKNSIKLFHHYYCNILTSVNSCNSFEKMKNISVLNKIDISKLMKVQPFIQKRSINNYDFLQNFFSICNTYPCNCAIKCGDKKVSYKELKLLSTNIAIEISKLKPAFKTQIVGILLDRSEYFIASILACWMVGCAYIAMEENYPVGRIHDLSDKSELNCLIIQNQDNIEKCNSFITHFIRLDKIDFLNKKNFSIFDNINIKPTDDAYIIFTSGSTGKPKGVKISHIGMMNHNDIMIDTFNISSSSAIAQTASASFDISVWQMTTTLLTGGTIVIYRKNIQLDPLEFFKHVKEDKITVLELVPSYLNSIIELNNETVISYILNSNIKYLLTTGESIDAQLVNRWQKKFGNIKLINAYGPAECSDDVTFYNFNPNKIFYNPIPIGKELQNIKIYILNKNLEIIPVGVKGEIYISGICVSNGYINDPVQTKERFIENPYSNGNVIYSKMYKTGDLGRWNINGEIEYFGRNDGQIKINGFRIEISEIENRISYFDGIIKNIVVVKKENNNTNILVCFYTGTNIDIEELKIYIRMYLPNYMIPQKFYNIKKFELNENGKINRTALQKYFENEKELIEQKNEDNAVLTEEQKKIISIWRKILKVPIKPNDNFFSIGGDSLDAMRLVALMEKENINYTIADIFKYQTINMLIKNSKKSKVINNKTELTTLPFMLTKIQKDFLTRNNDLRICNKYNQCLLLETKDLNITTLKLVFNLLLNQFNSFSLKFIKSQNGYVQQYIKNNKAIFLSYDILNKSFNPNYYIEELNNLLDIQKGINFAASYIKSQKKNYLIFVAHHLVIDILSWSFVLQFIDSSYSTLSLYKNEEIKISNRTEFCHWIYYLSNKNYENEFKYWLRKSNVKNPILRNTNNVRNIYENRIVSKFSFEDKKENINSILKELSLYSIETQYFIYYLIMKSLKHISEESSEYRVMIENNGRNLAKDIDITSSVGWFTVVYPIILNNKTNCNLIENLFQIKNEIEEATDNALSYAFFEKKTNSKSSPILINYTGRELTDFNYQNIKQISFVRENTINKKIENSYELEIDISFQNGILCFEIEYNKENLPSFYIADFCSSIKSEINKSFHDLTSKSNESLSFDLSPTQKGILFDCIYSGKKSEYAERFILKAENRIDFNSLKNTVAKLIKQNPILTEKLENIYTQPKQILSNCTVDKILYQGSVANLPLLEFDLQNDILFKIYLINEKNADTLVLDYHHIILDGESISKFLTSLVKNYKTTCSISPVKDLSFFRYVTYINNRESIDSEYWKTSSREYDFKLNSMSNLKYKRNNKNNKITEDNIEFKNNKVILIKKFCSELNITPSTFFMTCYASSLCNIQQENEVCIGVAIVSKPTKNILNENTLGIFINTLPIFIKISNKIDSSTFTSIQRKNYSIFERRFDSLIEIKKILNTRHNLFETIYSFNTNNLTNYSNKLISLSAIKYVQNIGEHLLVDVLYAEDKIKVCFTYNNSVFCEKKITKLINDFSKIIDNSLFHKETQLNNLGKLFLSKKTVLISTNNDEIDISKFKYVDLLKKIWKKILQTKEINQHSDFYKDGGDSLSAMRFVFALNEKGFAISIKDLFENPKITSLLQLLENCNHIENIKKTNRITLNRNIKSYKPSLLQKDIISNIKTIHCDRLYHDYVFFVYDQVINTDFMRQAWELTLYKYPILRSCFKSDKAIILDENYLDFLFSKESGDLFQIIHKYEKIDLNNNFNYETGPLFRIRLICVNVKQTILQMSFSVILFDGWCFATIFGDALKNYNLLNKNILIKKTVKEFCYINYINFLEKQDFNYGINFWKTKLEDYKYINYFEYISDNKNIADLEVLNYDFEDKSIIDKIKDLSSKNEISPSSLFQSIWCKILYSNKNTDKISYSLTTAGRNKNVANIDNAIGLFFNDIPISIHYDDKIKMAKEIQNFILESENTNYLPIGNIINGDSTKSITQTLFVFENYPKQIENSLRKVNAKLQNFLVYRPEVSQFDLTVYVEIANNLNIKIKYRKDLLNYNTIEKVFRDFIGEIQNV